MSASYSRVPRALLDDPEFLSASDAARSLLLTMYAHPSGHWTGAYRASAGILAEWHGRTRAQVESALADLSARGLAWCDGRVAVVPVLRSLALENPNQVTSVLSYAMDLPASPLIGRWLGWVEAGLRDEWRERFAPRLAQARERHGAEPAGVAVRAVAADVAAPATDEPMQVLLPCVEPPKRPAVAAVDAWNKATGQSLRPVDAHTRLASARLNEGASIADLALVGEWARRGPNADWWLGKNDRSTVYLRPATLWQASKFWAYLESARTWRAGGTSADADDDARARAALRGQSDREITKALAAPRGQAVAAEPAEPVEEW